MRKRKFEYAMNAIYYSFFTLNDYTLRIISKGIKKYFFPLIKYNLSEKLWDRYQSYLSRTESEGREMLQTTYSITTNWLFIVYSFMYATSFCAIVASGLESILPKAEYSRSIILACTLISFALVLIPIIRPAFKEATFQQYALIFLNKDEAWQKKWALIAAIYIAGSFAMVILALLIQHYIAK